MRHLARGTGHGCRSRSRDELLERHAAEVLRRPLASWRRRRRSSFGAVETAMVAELPLDRFGLPEEVAPTALLPTSDPGGNVYVGQTRGPDRGDVRA